MDTLSITEVCRRTGLSARAIRFYETRGLVRAERTRADQRRYGALEVERLHRLTLLKRAGFSLAQIAALEADRWLDLDQLIATQLAILTAQRAAIDEALGGLRAAQAALADDAAINIDTFCTLIKQGERTMTDQTQAWQKVTDRYFSPEDQDRWKAAKFAWAGGDVDAQAYQEKWADLGRRIDAALPLDLHSDTAQAFIAEWNALLAPFNQVADTRMKTETVAFYDRMDEWSGEVSPGFSKAVWEFVKAAAAARK